MAPSDSPAAALSPIPAARHADAISSRPRGLVSGSDGAAERVSPVHAPVPTASAELLVSAIALSIGASIHGPLLFLVGLPFALTGFVLTIRLLWNPRRTVRAAWMPRVEGWLAVMAAVGLIGSPLPAPLWFDVVQRLYFASGLAAIGLAANADARRAERAVRAMIVAGVALTLLAPIVVTNPHIDVWAVTQSAAHDLLHGIQPYTVRPPDFYNGLVDYKYSLTVYPYMPSTLLVFAPVVALLHDYRILLAICFPVTIALLRGTCRALAVDRSLTNMITLAVLLHPCGLSLSAPPTTPVEQIEAKLGSGATCTPKDGAASPMIERACAPAYCNQHWSDATGGRIASK